MYRYLHPLLFRMLGVVLMPCLRGTSRARIIPSTPVMPNDLMEEPFFNIYFVGLFFPMSPPCAQVLTQLSHNSWYEAGDVRLGAVSRFMSNAFE